MSFVRPLMFVFAMLGLGAVPVSAQQAPPPAQPAQSAPAPAAPVTLAQGYVLGPGDVIEVAVLGREEYRQRVQVQPDGTVLLLYLNSVRAANQTVQQLGEVIRQRLGQGGFYVDPAVSVTVVAFTSRYVTVLGEVATPGLLPVDRAYRVSEVLAKVGGVRSSAGDDIVLRRVNGQEERFLTREVASGGPENDPFVEPGDKFYVPIAPTFYIYGQVTAPGAYRVDSDLSLRKALARGGGLTDRGSERRIRLYRDGREVARASLAEAIKGGDTIVVGERFF